MTEHDLAQSENPDLRASFAALRRAAQLARKIAIQTDTEIVVMRDGKRVHITADELRRGEA